MTRFLFLFCLPWVAIASAEPVLNWNGAEKDPHPCLYVTAKDVAAAKATRKDIEALAKKESFGANNEETIAGVLLTQNPAAEKAAIAGANTDRKSTRLNSSHRT